MYAGNITRLAPSPSSPLVNTMGPDLFINNILFIGSQQPAPGLSLPVGKEKTIESELSKIAPFKIIN
jgi:hypothetical protein